MNSKMENGWSAASARTPRWRLATAVCLLALGSCGLAAAQASPATPQMPPTPTVQGRAPAAKQPVRNADTRKFTNQDVAQRPYNAVFTPPQFPSTPAVQKQFSVTYLYNYAQSEYTPPVPLPTIARSAQSFSTPENALIALVSAVRSGSYEDWLRCWDAASQAGYAAQEKADPGFRAKTMASNKARFAEPLVLFDRVDTVNYVVLDLHTGAAHTGPVLPVPVVLVFENSRWVASSQFYGDSLVVKQAFNMPDRPVTQTFDMRPDGKGTAAVNRAQDAFLQDHTQSGKVTVTVE